MKVLLRIICGVALSCMCLFVCIGYAGFTSNMVIGGTSTSTPPEGVFITNITSSGTNKATAVVNGYSMTVVNSSVNLGTNRNATLTFTITVFNNTNIDYGYNAMIYTVGEGTFDNETIVVTPNIERREVVRSKEYLSFDVTVSYVSGVTITNNVLNSVITYEFLPLDDIPEDEAEIAVSGVLEQFKNILNNNVIGNPNSYGQLITQMDDYNANDRHNDSYIGNVDGASGEDVTILGELFQGQLSLNINGTDTPVTLMIKEEDVDGNSVNGDEMTIYMTTDDLQKQNSSWFSQPEYAPVYAAVFRKVTLEDGTTTWERIGDMYLGSAEIKRYDGWPGSGSFDTDNWRLVTENGTRTSTTIQNIIQTLE